MGSITYRAIAERPALSREFKYVVSTSRADAIWEWVQVRVGTGPDTSIEYDTDLDLLTLCFDTEKFDVFHKRGSFRRSKYKIRRLDGTDTAILERKLRRKRRVSKRESVVSLDALDGLSEKEAHNDWDGYWFHRRILLRRLEPVCQIACHRTERVALVGDVAVRLTIDQDLRATAAGSIAFRSSGRSVALLEGKAIVKLTYQDRVPTVLKHLIEEFALDPKSVSKYRLGLKALGLQPEKKKQKPSNLGESELCLSH